MKKAMLTIEVLISMLILFLVISMSFSDINFFNILNKKKQNYEDIYIEVLNLRSKLSSDICDVIQEKDGKINDFSYSVKCEKLKQMRTYKKADEAGDSSGNIGPYLVKLYLIKLKLTRENIEKEFYYYKTISKKVKP